MPLLAKVLKPSARRLTSTCLLATAWVGACSFVVYSPESSTRGQLIGGAHVHVCDRK